MKFEDGAPAPPGKFASTVKVGAKGQIVIPKGARDLFGIKPGDALMLLADAEQGITIVHQDVFNRFISEAMSPTAGQPAVPVDNEAEQEDD